MNPFIYPPAAHQRRHGPQGYADAESFRPWLRDEFAYRCVYCLQREHWGQTRNANARPEGVQQSCFARREGGTLPATY